MKDHFDVLGLGSVSVDFLGRLGTWPMKGCKQCLDDFSFRDGGLVGTALVAVARLGGKACFAGKLGTSPMATRAVENLRKEGVDTSYVIETEGAEPIIAFVLSSSSDGQRNIFFTRQWAQFPMPWELPDKKWYQRASVLLIDYDSVDAGVEAAKVANQHGVPVVIDVEGDIGYTAEALALSTYIIVSEDFARDYTHARDLRQMLESLRSRPEQTVIITRGENGCVGLTAEGAFELPAFKVDVVDTTGCGDVFHGAFALAISRNRPVMEAARFASAAAALCATKLGGREGIPTQKELELFMKNIDQTVA